MSEKVFPSICDPDEGPRCTIASTDPNTNDFEFKVPLATTLTSSLSTQFSIDSNRNQNRKRSLPLVDTTDYKKVCTDSNVNEVNCEYPNIFEPQVVLQVDSGKGQTETYPQCTGYTGSSTIVGSNMCYASTTTTTTFDSAGDLKMSDLSDMNVPSEFHQPQECIDPEKLQLCESLGLEPRPGIIPSSVPPSSVPGPSSQQAPKGAQNYTNIDLNQSEIDAMIDGLNDEINNILEETAERNKLTATNVKNILRHVITNEYVLAMVRNTMKSNGDEEGELEDAVYEPKLTRSKAKELREKQAALPWPVSSPAKQNTKKITKKLLEEEFSDDENSSDEEYRPNEEVCHSEEEEATSPKVDSIGSPQSDKNLRSSPEKIPDWDMEPPPLVIAEPKAESEADLIALRTRSKLPLVDTPLETIEASFIAPDITVDMYDTECDDEDWQNFLLEFTKPLDTKTSLEFPDDDGDDPEYNVLEEDEDVLDDDAISLKISQKELNALMDAILETAEQELIENEDEEDDDVRKEEITVQPQINVQSDEILQQCTANDTSSRWFSDFERLQLEEQMRMHVQLLTQSFLLSHGIKEIQEMNDASFVLLEELGRFSERVDIVHNKSYFRADNLEEAITIANAYKAEKCIATITPKTFDKKPGIPARAKETIAHSKVFIYPHLLPSVGFRPNMELKAKSAFTEAEDLLLSLGLEQFSPIEKSIEWIQTLLLPTKTLQQLKLRIKNCRLSKCSGNHPIKYYYIHKQAPPIVPCVRPYDPAAVKPPCELPSELVPKWMFPYLVKILPLLAPAPLNPSKVAIVHPLSFKTSERRKYQRILPRMSYVSPFKKISPILKKYSQHRRIANVLPLTSSASKFTRYHYKSMLPLIKPKPPAVAKTKIIPVTIAPCFLPVEHLNAAPVLIPPVTTAIVLKPEPVFISDMAQIVPKPEPSNLPSEDSVVVEVAPVIYDSNSSGQLKSDKKEDNKKDENRVECKEVTDNGVEDNKNNDDGDQNCIVDVPEVEHFENAAIVNLPYDVPDNGQTAGVTSGGDNVLHDQEMPHDLEVCEEADDEVIDDEEDLAALMAASSTICKKQHSSIKKKNKHQRDLESTLQLLAPNILKTDPKKEERETIFAQAYLLRVMEALKDDPQKCERFLKTLCSYEYCTKSPIKLFAELSEILKGHPVLIEEFVGFLSPEQAKECGKFIQYTTISKIRVFLRKMEIHFSNQPHHIQRILRTLGQLQNQEELTSAAVITALQPLLRNQSHLLEEFLQLLPDEPPPEWYANTEKMLLTDFEDIKVPNNSDSEISSCDSFEEMKMPEGKDLYGGKDCPCSCHSSTVDLRIQNRSRHCVQCGTKFIDGRVYIQTGKGLKPAQVVYHSTNPLLSPNCNNLELSKTESRQNLKNCTDNGGSPQRNSPCQELLLIEEYPQNKVENATEEEVTSTGLTVTPTEQTLNTVAENLDPTASVYPCDVIEDAVLPPVTNNGLNSIPADFSRLQESFSLPSKTSIAASEEVQKSYTKQLNVNESVNYLSKVNVTNSQKESGLSQVKAQNEINSSASSASLSAVEKGGRHPIETWTRDEDKVIFETLKKHGVNKESFVLAANVIRTRTVQQIENRFVELMQKVKKSLQATKS